MQNNKPWDAQLACRLITGFRYSSLSPNHLTALRLLLGVMACAALAMGNYFWTNTGAICFVLSNFMDHIDGEYARVTGKMTGLGHYFDLAADALVNILIPFLILASIGAPLFAFLVLREFPALTSKSSS